MSVRLQKSGLIGSGRRACPREAELRQVIECGQWPQACPADLRAHAEGCADCRALLMLRLTFRSALDESAMSARLEQPGVLWWRAQLRRRQARMETLKRPLLAAQIFAAVVALSGTALAFALRADAGQGWLLWMRNWLAVLGLDSIVPAGSGAPFATAIWIGGAVLLLGLGAAAAARLKRPRNG